MDCNNKIKVMIADNHEVARIGMKKLLAKNKEIKIVAVADKGEEILKKIKKRKPDVVIMDNNFSNINSTDVAAYTSKYYPYCRVVVHPATYNAKSIMNEISSGVSGYVPKNMEPENIIEAIKTVHKGGKFLKGNIADIFINNFFKEKRETEILYKLQQILSKREIEILKMLGEGLSVKQTAEKLFLSIRTAETHRFNIKKKLKIHSKAELVMFAIKNNLITV